MLEKRARGMPFKLIAADLGISENSVGSYLRRAREKLGLPGRRVLRAAVSNEVSSDDVRRALAPLLTGAEYEVALGLVAGRCNAEIAAERGTSIRTVDNQVREVLRKLQIGSRFELMSKTVWLVQRNCL